MERNKQTNNLDGKKIYIYIHFQSHIILNVIHLTKALVSLLLNVKKQQK